MQAVSGPQGLEGLQGMVQSCKNLQALHLMCSNQETTTAPQAELLYQWLFNGGVEAHCYWEHLGSALTLMELRGSCLVMG